MFSNGTVMTRRKLINLLKKLNIKWCDEKDAYDFKVRAAREKGKPTNFRQPFYDKIYPLALGFD